MPVKIKSSKFARAKTRETKKLSMNAMSSKQKAEGTRRNKTQRVRKTTGPPTDDIVKKIIKVAQSMAEKSYYPYQVDFSWGLCENVIERTGESLSALFSRQAGKTEVVGGTPLALAIILPYLSHLFPEDQRFNRVDRQGRYRGYRKGFNVGIYAPTETQAKVTFLRIKGALKTDTSKRILEELGVTYGENNGDTVSFIKYDGEGREEWKSSIKSATASPTAKIEGETFHLLVLEEAQDLDDLKVEKSLSPMVSSTKGCVVFVGTAGTRKCAFLRAILRNRRKEVMDSKKRHFFYPYQVCVQYNSDYESYVEQEKEKYGEDSDAFKMAYGCMFILERGMFITEKFLMDPSVALEYGLFSEIIDNVHIDRKVPPKYSIVAGIDFAKSQDSTVVTIIAVNWIDPVVEQFIPDEDNPGCDKLFRLYQKHVIGWMELHGDNYESQFRDILAYLRPIRRLSRITVDSTSVGSAIFDRLKAVIGPTGVEVDGIHLGEHNKSNTYKALLSDLIQKRVTFPFGKQARKARECRKFVVEMLDAEKESKSNGIMRVQAPNEKDAHDDFCDSLAIATLAASEPVGEPTATQMNFSLFR